MTPLDSFEVSDGTISSTGHPVVCLRLSDGVSENRFFCMPIEAAESIANMLQDAARRLSNPTKH